MRISIIVPDLSCNCLGRPYLLAKILGRRFDVEVVGSMTQDGIWPPLAGDTSVTYRMLPIRGRLKPYWDLPKLGAYITGDVIYASKPLWASLGVGLMAKLRRRKPLILDIDDWEIGLANAALSEWDLPERLRYLAASTLFLYRHESFWNALAGEVLAKCADGITVASSFLRRRYGGTVVRHARDTAALDPSRFDGRASRERLGIKTGSRVVMFAGTPRPHKGLDDLIDAVAGIEDDRACLVVVGLSEQDPYCKDIRERGGHRLGSRFVPVGLRPFSELPELLAAADVLVIPQRQSPAAAGQVPMKVFDAMAMAAPIIATRVGDLPEILDGCGWLVEPEDTTGLATRISYVLDHPDEARKAGLAARAKCVAEYSWDAVEGTLAAVIQQHTGSSLAI